jgi:hypothetical protein
LASKRKRPSKKRSKKPNKLQRGLLTGLKKRIRSRRRDYKSEYKRRVAAAKKRYKAEIAAAKKRRDAALRGAATRKANALKAKRSAAARKGVATRKANAKRKKQDAQPEKVARLTSSQVKVIRNWHATKFNPHGFKEIPTEEELVEFAQERGYFGFKDYRKIWDAARSTYVKEVADDVYISRGYQYLVELTDMAKVRPEGEEQWLYYH